VVQELKKMGVASYAPSIGVGFFVGKMLEAIGRNEYFSASR
jgi:F0F1-type ATP synthase membrane subunit c/vacuolar-type H+-ATPase subunit K